MSTHVRTDSPPTAISAPPLKRVGAAILIVEDSIDDTLLLLKQFDRVGISNPRHIVVTAEEATAYLQGVDPFADRDRFPVPGVIMLDLKLPGIDGLRFLQWCRTHAHCKETLLVVLSGVGDTNIIRSAYELGAHTFLTKPCRVADLENLIQGFPGFWDHQSPRPLSAPLTAQNTANDQLGVHPI